MQNNKSKFLIFLLSSLMSTTIVASCNNSSQAADPFWRQNCSQRTRKSTEDIRKQRKAYFGLSSTVSGYTKGQSFNNENGNESPTGCHTNPGDPDTIRNAREIIESRGFDSREYDVITRDGYILTLHRIINPLIDANDDDDLKPVILQHGLMTSASDWVINSVDTKPTVTLRRILETKIKTKSTSFDAHLDQSNSLGFYLANRGYDVFLANSRGNVYAKRHLLMRSQESQFWDFSFDENIEYDLPAVIEYVLKLTGKNKTAYIGHSQGSAMMFGLMSKYPHYADIIEPFIALAPVAFVNNALTPMKQLDFLTYYLRHENRPFTTDRELIDFLAARVCSRNVILRELCKNFIFLVVGFDEEELDEKRIPSLLCHVPSGTSLRNLAHYGQELQSGRFAHFDFGQRENLIRYGQVESPDYELQNIRSKSMVWFTAENDWLASPKDVANLEAKLRVKLYGRVNMTQIKPKWNHIDFIYGKSTGKLINPKVHEFLEQFH